MLNDILDSVNVSFMKNSIEYKMTKLSLIRKEINKRKEMFYYSYEPAGLKHTEFHNCVEKVKGLIGANRSAKTHTVMHEVQMLMLGEHPVIPCINTNTIEGKRTAERMLMNGDVFISVPNKWWWIEPSNKKIEETDGALQKWKETFPPNMLERIEQGGKGGIYKLVAKNGSEITFKSQKEDINSFTSASINGAVINERLEEEDKRLQIRMRTLDTNGFLFFTMDALNIDDWVEELVDKNLAKCWKIHTEDNKFISKAGIERFKQELDTENINRLLYGDAGLKGYAYLFPQSIFNKFNYQPKPSNSFFVDMNTLEIIENEQGNIMIFEEPLVNVSYIIAADCAEGQGGDDSAFSIWRTDIKMQVASFSDNTTSVAEFADIIYLMANKYNKALVAVENDKRFGNVVIEKLLEYGDCDVYSETINPEFKYSPSKCVYGIRTVTGVRQQLIQWTYDDIVNNRIIITDPYLKSQLNNYVRQQTERGTVFYRGRGKKKDDLAMSCMLADRALRFTGYLFTEAKTTKTKEEVEEKKDSNKKEIFLPNGRQMFV